MKLWRVVTPEYGEVVPVTDEGQGPMEYGCDVVEIEADTRRDAIVIGVKLMRTDLRRYRWFDKCGWENPFSGVRAVLVNVAYEAHCETCEACLDGDCDEAKALLSAGV